MLAGRLWEAREQRGRQAAWWQDPGVPRGRSPGHGHAAQGEPGCELAGGWGCHPVGRERGCRWKDLWGCLPSWEGSEPRRWPRLAFPWKRERQLEAGWPAHPDHPSSPTAQGFDLVETIHEALPSHCKSPARTLLAGASLFWGEEQGVREWQPESTARRFQRARNALIFWGTSLQSPDGLAGPTEGPRTWQDRLDV